MSITDATEAADKTLQDFSYSEMKLYEHAVSHKWTVGKLVSIITF
jgi:hypothetical protein